MNGTPQIVIGIIGLFVNAIGLGFVAFQLGIARRQAHAEQIAQADERTRLKRQQTVEFATATLSERNRLRSMLPDDYDHAGIAGVVKKCLEGEDPGTSRTIVRYLGYMETLAVPISMGSHDLETADSLFGGRILAIWSNYKPFVENERKKRASSYFCCELEWLATEVQAFRETPRGYDQGGNYIPFALRGSDEAPSLHPTPPTVP